MRHWTLLWMMAWCVGAQAGDTRLTVSGDKILRNDQVVKLIGLRCSNALVSDAATDDLIDALDLYHPS